jgi:glycosyltransferase involved in cell wall biosynthesis
VHLASTRQFSDQPWTEEAIRALRSRGLEELWIHRRFRGQGRLERLEARYSSYQGMDGTDWHFCSWWLRRWFRRLMYRINPASVVMHYALADRLLDHASFPDVHRIIEMHDVLSVNAEIRTGLERRVKHFVQTGEPGELFDTDLRWAEKFIPAQEELAIYDKYHAVIAIAHREQVLLQRNLRHAKVQWIPMHIPPVNLESSYDAPPIFCASGNKFNQVGLLVLLNEVLPRVLANCPDFRFDVAGDISQFAIPSRNVRYIGYVQNLVHVCQKAAFAICPVFAGTGQQVKIIEAMAHGLPVVAFRRTAAESPLRHGENGLVAANTDEFATHLVNLWCNRDLCRHLGTAARALLDNLDDTAMALRSLISI